MKLLIGLFLAALPVSEGPLLDICVENSLLASKIAIQEGFWVKNSLPERFHNPGALVFSNQPFASLGKRGFAKFDCAFHGWEALEKDLTRKLRRKKPLSSAWAYLGAFDKRNKVW